MLLKQWEITFRFFLFLFIQIRLTNQILMPNIIIFYYLTQCLNLLFKQLNLIIFDLNPLFFEHFLSIFLKYILLKFIQLFPKHIPNVFEFIILLSYLKFQHLDFNRHFFYDFIF